MRWSQCERDFESVLGGVWPLDCNSLAGRPGCFVGLGSWALERRGGLQRGGRGRGGRRKRVLERETVEVGGSVLSSLGMVAFAK